MFRCRLILLLSIAIIHGVQSSAPFDIRIDHHKVSTTRDLVVNTGRPRFSWKLPQTDKRNVQQNGYQIQIRSDKDQWDSEYVHSSQSIHVPYMNSRDLQPLTHYQFRLRIWTTDSEIPSSWTDWISFRTPIFNLHQYLMEKNDDVFWIGSTQIYMNELRKEFNISDQSPIRTATIFISGIGYYELYLNGESVDPTRKLDPGWTTYEKRTLFVSYDVTTTIKIGMNAVGVKLGNGWYSQEQYLPPSSLETSYGKFFIKIE